MAEKELATLPKAYIERLVKITQEATVVAFEPSHESHQALKRLRTELALLSENELPIVERYIQGDKQPAPRRNQKRLFQV